MKGKGDYIIWLILILIIAILLSLVIGSVKIPFLTAIQILISKLPFIHLEQYWTNGQEAILLHLRLPRIILAIIVGGMLSISGVSFQGVLRNPLADPYILGISSGAALGAAFAIIFIENIIGPFALPIFAFIGGILSLLLVMFLANAQHFQKNETIILAGVIIQSLSGAVLSFLIAISGDKMQSIIFWMMGSFANSDYLDIWIILPYFIVGSIFLYTQYRELNIMSLGENAAGYLGMNVQKRKFGILIVASFLTASAVAIVGIIGFVGLVIPHLIRLITGPNHKVLIPVATIGGAIFLLLADTVARTAIPSKEIPIGVITALIGAPFFAFLLRRGLRRGYQ